MSGRFPRVTASEAIKALEKAGYVLVRQSGSHKIFRNKDGQRVTIPYHSGMDLHPMISKSFLKDADLTLKEFKELVR
jgi:predicted RNA binding protein YcfA (HicA-like mRNA interferase family)